MSFRLFHKNIEGNVITSDKEYKVIWSNPLKCYITLYAPDILKETLVNVNNKEMKTDAQGRLLIDCTYGEETALYIRHDLWSKGIIIRGGEGDKEVDLNADFQYVKVYKASGSLLKNTNITIGGKSYTSDSDGLVLLIGDYGTSKSLKFQAGANDYATKSVSFKGGTTNITLEAHVVAGSISASVWNFNSSAWDKKALTFTAPTYVKVIKLTGSGFDGWSDEANDSAYVGTSSSSESAGGTVIFSGTGSFTKYIGVTPGKTYTLYGRWISGGTLAYSDDINKQSVDVNLG